MWSLPALGLFSLVPLASVRAVPFCLKGTSAVATTWYTGWHAQYLAVEDISWEKYTSVRYAFAETTPDSSVVSLQDSDQQLLKEFVRVAHQNNVDAIITLGGWTGSRYFSSSVGSAENRTMFAKAILNLVDEYNLDGVDIDWEYPNKQGLGCNVISPQDTPNFLAFLQELRSTPGGKDIAVTAATSIVPFASPDGTPTTDVSAFAAVLDYVTLMNYDIWGSWSAAVGPNAPLDDSCAPTQQGSAVSAVTAWKAAGFPANQLVLAVASYGHSYFVSQDDAFAGAEPGADQPAGTRPLAAYPPFSAAQQPLGDSWDAVAPAGPDECGVDSPGGPSGIFNFKGLIEKGWLNGNGTVVDGMGFRYDDCSQTPYLYDSQTSTMVSYDDAQSFAAKGQFIRESGLLGFSMWEAAGDHNDILLDAVSGSNGLSKRACEIVI